MQVRRKEPGRDGGPTSWGFPLQLWAVSLLAANSAKLTYILSCLDGVISTLIPNCLKPLVVMHSNMSYKNIRIRKLC